MTASERFQLIIAGMTFMFLLLSTVLGMVWRNGSKQGQANANIENLASDVKDIAEKLDRHILWHMGRGKP
jgi:Na+-transporting methylmalonyl-CoA/oxaloacetate decarboxylase gamma subunit